jgi:hypothetical protein
MIAAETALDAFWHAAGAHWTRYVGTTPMALVKHVIGDRAIQRTSPWIEPKKTPSIQRELLVEQLAFSGHTHDVSKQVTGNFKKLDISVKDKKKTRRLVELEPATVLTPEAVVEDAVPAATLAVDKRAFKVYSTLFHSPDSPNQPGEIAWPDFLHAMVKAGFGAMKLQGSAWHFTPERSDVDRSIQFHEPHPGNKLPFTWARRYGRRLTRAYGWTRESFTLA